MRLKVVLKHFVLIVALSVMYFVLIIFNGLLLYCVTKRPLSWAVNLPLQMGLIWGLLYQFKWSGCGIIYFCHIPLLPLINHTFGTVIYFDLMISIRCRVSIIFRSIAFQPWQPPDLFPFPFIAIQDTPPDPPPNNASVFANSRLRNADDKMLRLQLRSGQHGTTVRLLAQE